MKSKNMSDFGFLTQSSAITKKHMNRQELPKDDSDSQDLNQESNIDFPSHSKSVNVSAMDHS